MKNDLITLTLEIDFESCIKILNCIKDKEPIIYEKLRAELLEGTDKFLNEGIRESVEVSCDTCKYLLPEDRCSHPHGCDGDYELWEQDTPERT